MYRVLLVEDNHVLAEIIEFYISSDDNFTLRCAPDAETALKMVREEGTDLILLDILLPGMDGLALCQKLRESVYCPIIFISSLDDDGTIIKALELGGDDYLVKPFKCPVLMAKMRAVLRRALPGGQETIELAAGNLCLNSEDHTATVEERRVYLSPTEFAMLGYFMRNPGKVLELEELYTAVWQRPSYGDLRTVPVHVGNLRKKIEEHPGEPRYIKTVKRIGYMFCTE